MMHNYPMSKPDDVDINDIVQSSEFDHLANRRRAADRRAEMSEKNSENTGSQAG